MSQKKISSPKLHKSSGSAPYWIAWLMFLAGMAGFGTHVLGLTIVWSNAARGSTAELDFFRVIVITLAIFSNLMFLVAPSFRRGISLTTASKAFLISAVAINGSLAFFFPSFALFPTYWLWLLSFVTMAVTLGAFSRSSDLSKYVTPETATTDDGGLPLLIRVWLGFTIFWLALSGFYRFHPVTINPEKEPTPAALTDYLSDPTRLISDSEAAQLRNLLSTFENETSNQIAVSIYASAPKSGIEQFTIETAEQSRLGRKGLDNGAILFVFLKERIARLEVGYGLESVLTDADSRRILETQLAPAFAKGNYGAGLDGSLNALFHNVREAYQRGQMPSKLTVLWSQLKVKIPKLIDQAGPALNVLSPGERIVITFFASLLWLGIWDGMRQSLGLFRNLASGIGNIRAGRAFTTGMEGIRFGSIVDTIKVGVLALVAILGMAGLALVADGGTFGGAGALLHW